MTEKNKQNKNTPAPLNRHSRAGGNPNTRAKRVIPAQAGIPPTRHSRASGNPTRPQGVPIPQSAAETPKGLEGLNFTPEGLIPVIAQCAQTGEVLMMAWMTRETLAETIETGKMVYYSRSRKTRWQKGEQSGNTQQCLTLTADCDRDTILAKVHQKGPACHTGKKTCFFTPLP